MSVHESREAEAGRQKMAASTAEESSESEFGVSLTPPALQFTGAAIPPNNGPLQRQQGHIVQRQNEQEAETRQELDRAKSHLFNGQSSVMDRREDAVREFVTRLQEPDDPPSPSLLKLAATAALSAATGGIGAFVATSLTASLTSGVLASALNTVLKNLIASSITSSVNQAPDVFAGSSGSVGQFEELQVRAISSATRSLIDQFDQNTQDILSAEDGLAQATALADAYRDASEPAYNKQALACYSEWSKIVDRGARFSDDGILELNFEVDQGLSAPVSASQGGLSSAAKNSIRSRQGTIGDLFASGMAIRINLEFEAWRPFLGGESVTMHLAGSRITLSHPAESSALLMSYMENEYGEAGLEGINGAAAKANIAAHIIFGRDISPIALSALPTIE